ncbi:hypothetical protein PM082_006315 [Marasmius tenuissimus]|nr:hypothetical protein PM082_006315 [Marasmius tenuissimus]
MPRPKLYHTKAERKEANRVKNKRFYNKHRSDILSNKLLKREEQNKAIEKEGIRLRKKRREVREKEKQRELLQRRESTEVNEEVSTKTERLSGCIKTLEGQLVQMKKDYRVVAGPDDKKCLEAACKTTIRWKQWARRCSTKQATGQSPLLDWRKYLERKLMDYQAVEDEYFYAIREQVGQSWDEKRGDFTAYRDLLVQMIALTGELKRCRRLESRTWVQSRGRRENLISGASVGSGAHATSLSTALSLSPPHVVAMSLYVAE